jgi:osmotically inducible lipoprotein OsmB
MMPTFIYPPAKNIPAKLSSRRESRINTSNLGRQCSTFTRSDNTIFRTLISLMSAVTLASALSARGTPNRQQVGIGTGAVLGGMAGHAITDGSALGTVGGAAIGGVAGS